MVLSILAAVSAAVQLGMGAGSAVVDHATLKDNVVGGYVPYHYVNASSSASWRYFTIFGCSATQREKYPTVKSQLFLFAVCIQPSTFSGLIAYLRAQAELGAVCIRIIYLLILLSAMLICVVLRVLNASVIWLYT